MVLENAPRAAQKPLPEPLGELPGVPLVSRGRIGALWPRPPASQYSAAAPTSDLSGLLEGHEGIFLNLFRVPTVRKLLGHEHNSRFGQCALANLEAPPRTL